MSLNRLYITNLKLRAFRSFVQETNTGPLPLTGLVGIKGLSGHGKSSLHLAIAYVLRYCPVPATELQSWSWLTDELMQVELTLATPLGEIIVKRGEIDSISINGIITAQGSSRAVETELHRVLKIKTDLLESLTFREQRKPGRFISMSDSQKKDFLSQLLELDELENQISKYGKIADKYKEKADAHDLVAMTLTSQLVQPDPVELENTTALEAALMDLDALVKANSIKLSALKRTLNIEKAKLDKRINDLTLALSAKMDEIPSHFTQNEIDFQKANAESILLKEEMGKLTTAAQKYSTDLSVKKSQLQEKLNVINRDLDGMDNSICPTCKQSWCLEDMDKWALYRKKLDLESQLAQCNQPIADAAPDLSEKIKRLGELQNICWKLSDLKANKQKELGARNNELKLNHINATKVLTQEFETNNKDSLELFKVLAEDTNKAQLFKLSEQLKALEFKNTLRQEQYNTEMTKYNSYIKRINEECNSRDELKKQNNVELDYVETIKSFLGSIFDEVLYEISTEANEYLKNLPNVEGITIEFATERVTQKGVAKQEIKVLANKNGNLVSLRALSGGQQSAIELSVDLAVATVVGRRTGTFFAFLVLDESFDGMDIQTKESCLELLKTASKDRLIFMIDHSTEITSFFDKFITIEYDGNTSVLRNS